MSNPVTDRVGGGIRKCDEMKKYELYKGYELLAVGTVAEIASRLGVKKGTVRFYKSPVYQRRVKGENTRMLMEVDE